MISGPNMPNCFFKAKTPKAALNILCHGLRPELVKILQTSEEYKVEEMTWEKFQELLPDEFTISDDVSF